MRLFGYRLLGAAMLDAGMYEGIEADPATTGQAFATVVLASIAAGLGAGDWLGDRSTTFPTIMALAVLTWGAWAMLIFQIGTRLLPEPETRATWDELLRTTGFAAAPGLLQVFGLLPYARTPVFVVTTIWMFVAMVLGARHALDYRSTGRALAVCALAATLSVGLAALAGLLFTKVAS